MGVPNYKHPKKKQSTHVDHEGPDREWFIEHIAAAGKKGIYMSDLASKMGMPLGNLQRRSKRLQRECLGWAERDTSGKEHLFYLPYRVPRAKAKRAVRFQIPTTRVRGIETLRYANR